MILGFFSAILGSHPEPTLLAGSRSLWALFLSFSLLDFFLCVNVSVLRYLCLSLFAPGMADLPKQFSPTFFDALLCDSTGP